MLSVKSFKNVCLELKRFEKMLRNIVFLSKINGMNEELKELYREIKVDNETDNGINEKKKVKKIFICLPRFL